jgi:hypothetical protein
LNWLKDFTSPSTILFFFLLMGTFYFWNYFLIGNSGFL